MTLGMFDRPTSGPSVGVLGLGGGTVGTPTRPLGLPELPGVAAARAEFEEQTRLLFPWMPPELVRIYAAAWTDTGDPTQALATLRASNEYQRFFPGIRRADGSLRMTEQEYFATKEAYSTLIRGYGLNPEVFSQRFTGLIEGDVSPSELAARLGAAYEDIITNIPQVRAEYARLFGVEGGEQALFAAFIDPDVGEAILQRRIGVAQVAGEAVARGFSVTRSFAESLASGGVDQARAREFFSQADNLVPTLDTLARRHLDPDDDFDLVEFAQAGIFGDSEQSLRIRRLFGAEAASFSGQTGTLASSEGTLTGLTLR